MTERDVNGRGTGPTRASTPMSSCRTAAPIAAAPTFPASTSTGRTPTERGSARGRMRRAPYTDVELPTGDQAREDLDDPGEYTDRDR